MNYGKVHILCNLILDPCCETDKAYVNISRFRNIYLISHEQQMEIQTEHVWILPFLMTSPTALEVLDCMMRTLKINNTAFTPLTSALNDIFNAQEFWYNNVRYSITPIKPHKDAISWNSILYKVGLPVADPCVVTVGEKVYR